MNSSEPMPEHHELGAAINAHRIAASKTKEDMAGAIEVELSVVDGILKGDQRPDAEMLELIVSYLSLRSNEANRIRKISGYLQTEDAMSGALSADLQEIFVPKPVKADSLSDSDQILYTDVVHVVASSQGVVISFIQGLDSEGNPNVISRVGMSHKHVKSIIEVLKRSLG